MKMEAHLQTHPEQQSGPDGIVGGRVSKVAATGGRTAASQTPHANMYLAAVQVPEQRLLINDATTGAVDDADAILALFERLCIQHVVRLGRVGRVERDYVGATPDIIQGDCLDAVRFHDLEFQYSRRQHKLVDNTNTMTHCLARGSAGCVAPGGPYVC